MIFSIKINCRRWCCDNLYGHSTGKPIAGKVIEKWEENLQHLLKHHVKQTLQEIDRKTIVGLQIVAPATMKSCEDFGTEKMRKII